MLSNRFISPFSMFLTIALFILTVFLGFFIFYINFSTPFAWFVITLFIGSFISFMKCLNNLNKLKNLSTQEYTSEEIRSGKIKTISSQLTTCPDYWTKNVVIDPSTNVPVTLCYNEYIDENGKSSYLGGTLEMISPSSSAAPPGADPIDADDESGDNMDATFVFSNDSIFETGTTLQQARDMFTDETHAVEEFTQYRRSDPEYQDHLHTHESVVRHIDGVVDVRGNEGRVDPAHTHTRYYGRGYHSHNMGPGADAYGSGEDQERYREEFNNFTNWISPYKTNSGKYAIEINLNKLNKATNTCELAKKFIWSDVFNNCSK